MTVLRDDEPLDHSSGAMNEPLSSPSRAHHTLARGKVLTGRARAWLSYYRAELMLLGPAAVYLGLVGFLLLHRPGLALAAMLTALLAAAGPRIPANTMLSLYRAEPIAPGQGVALRGAIAAMSARAGLAHEPALAIIPSLAVGAFSAGAQPRMALMLTEGLLRRHSLREIVARAAHEIAHMRNGDLPVLALADTLTRLAQALFYLGVLCLAVDAVAWLAGEQVFGTRSILLLLAAPMLNSQLQLALPRQREFDADILAAHLLGDASVMAGVAQRWEDDRGSMIDDFRLPVPQRRSPTPSPLRAHPEPSDRASRLRAIDPASLGAPLPLADEPLISLVGFGPIEMRPRNRWPGLWF